MPNAGRPRLPQLVAGREIERADLLVHRRGDEHEPARGDDRTADVGRAPGLERIERPFLDLAERHAPADLAGGQVDRRQLAPRRRIARHAEERHQDLAPHAERRAALRRRLVVRDARLRTVVELRARNTCAMPTRFIVLAMSRLLAGS